METLTAVVFFIGVIAYSVAATLYFVEFSRKKASHVGKRWAPRAVLIGAIAHASHVVSASFLSNVCPVKSGHFALSLAALVAVIVFLSYRARSGLHVLGAFVTPLALMFLVAAQFVRVETRATEVSRVLLALHVTANLFGVGLFLLAGALALLYLMHERRLRAHKGGASHLPALDVLDRNEHRLLLVGFPLLSFGAVSGAVFASQLGEMSGIGLLRAGLGYAAWLLVAFVLGLRALAGWRGRRSAYGTILGALCLFLLVVLYAVRPVAETLL